MPVAEFVAESDTELSEFGQFDREIREESAARRDNDSQAISNQAR